MITCCLYNIVGSTAPFLFALIHPLISAFTLSFLCSLYSIPTFSLHTVCRFLLFRQPTIWFELLPYIPISSTFVLLKLYQGAYTFIPALFCASKLTVVD
uniref:Uncharacterized protein n=1 Tax=Sparus aurata TaxID=8175 RepID=A0A671UU62_SPAAU